MLKYKSLFLLLVTFLVLSSKSHSQINLNKYLHHQWVDSVFNALTPDERIAQLIWIDVNSGEDLQRQFRVADLIRTNKFGGIIFFGGKAVKQAELTNYYQSISSTPLMVAMDAEWGPAMRLDDVEPFPYNIAMGAVSDDQLLKKCGAEMAIDRKSTRLNSSH